MSGGSVWGRGSLELTTPAPEVEVHAVHGPGEPGELRKIPYQRVSAPVEPRSGQWVLLATRTTGPQQGVPGVLEVSDERREVEAAARRARRHREVSDLVVGRVRRGR